MTNTLHLRSLLAAGVSAVALIGAAPAFAAPGPAAASSSETTVGEIIVTAEKREASIQSVPIAVTAFTSKERAIQGINTVQDMTNFTPGLTYSSQLDRPVMRGLARNNNEYTSDSAVAVYYDDFFSQSTFLVGRDDMLIDQVEILLGPQGTLYGRNAVGGLINTVSKRPSDDFNGEVRAIAGNYGYNKIEGTITGPIAGGWDFRFSAVDLNQSQGYFKDTSGLPSEGDVRHDPYADLQLQYKGDKNEVWIDVNTLGFNNDRGGPGSLLGVPLAGHYETSLTDTEVPLIYNPNAPYNPANVVPGSVVGMTPGFSDNPTASNIRQFAHAIPTTITVNADFTAQVHLIHHFDGFDVKYVGGYSQYHYNLNTDFYDDPSSITQFQTPGAASTVFPKANFQYETLTKWYSQELNFTSTNDSRLQWIGGLYRYDEIDDNSTPVSEPDQAQFATPVLALNAAGNPDLSTIGTVLPNPSRDAIFYRYQDHIMSTAGFGQLDFKLTDTLKLTGGIRYTYDQKNATQETRYVAFTPATNINLHALIPGLPANGFSVDATKLEIDQDAQRGVTRLPYLATTGPYAGAYISELGDSSSAVTGTAGIEWTPDHSTLAYARYNRGYKAFGFAAGSTGPGVEAVPEYINDYEAGIKKGFGRRLQIDADVFYYDYINAQIPLGVANAQGLVVTEFLNVPKSVSEGIEITANWEPIDHLSLSLTYALDHSSITTGCSPAAGTLTGAAGFCVQDSSDPGAVAPGARPVGVNIGTAAAPGFVQSVKNAELPNTPENKVAFNANYTWEFEPGNLTLSGSYVWKDKSYIGLFDRTYNEAPSWDQVDGRLTWAGNHDKYEVVLYVKNLFNTLGYDAASASVALTDPVPTFTGTSQAPSYDLTPPRLFGVEVHYKF
jgi:iron complex outermembrane receptor protein